MMAKRSWLMTLLALAIVLLPRVWGAEPEVAHKDLIDAMNAGRGTGPNRIPKELPQDGSIILNCGDYKLLVEPARAFTISECYYRGAKIIMPAGAQGTVILTQQAHKSIKENSITEKGIWGDPWIGTAHGGEIVREVTLTVDGQTRPLATGTEIRGDRIVLDKVSTQYKFENRTSLALRPEGFEEHRELRAKEDVGNLHYFYLFMFSWPTTTEKYLAGYPDGSEKSEEFGQDRSIALASGGSGPRWYAQYDPTLKLGIVQFTPDAAPGPAFVQVRKNYHKHYTQFGTLTDKVFKSGELIKRTVYVRVFADPTGDWSAARTVIAELEKRTSTENGRDTERAGVLEPVP